MAVEFNNFDPLSHVLTIAGIPVYGFSTGTMINAERNTDTFSLIQGARGDGTRVRSRDRSGKITFNIMAACSCNDLLSARMALDELLGTGYGALLIKDVAGSTIVQAANAWLVRPANLGIDTDPTPREWTIEAHVMKMHIGGSLI